MYKRFLRCISMLLVLVMLAEMLPATGIGSLVPKVYATDGSLKSSNTVYAPVESQNTVSADIPATIIDETDHTITEDTAPSPAPTESSDSNTLPAVPSGAQDTELLRILKGADSFSALSSEDAAYLCHSYDMADSDFAALEADGVSLLDSVTYAVLAKMA